MDQSLGQSVNHDLSGNCRIRDREQKGGYTRFGVGIFAPSGKLVPVGPIRPLVSRFYRPLWPRLATERWEVTPTGKLPPGARLIYVPKICHVTFS